MYLLYIPKFTLHVFQFLFCLLTRNGTERKAQVYSTVFSFRNTRIAEPLPFFWLQLLARGFSYKYKIEPLVNTSISPDCLFFFSLFRTRN